MSEITQPGIYSVPATVYHGDPAPEPSISASLIRMLLEASPLHAWRAHPRLGACQEPEETAFSDCGRAAHALLLEGRDLIDVIDAKDWRTNAAKDARDDSRLAGRVPLLPDDAAAVYAMAEAARQQLADHEACDTFTAGKAEQTVLWREGDVWCRALVDWLPDQPRWPLQDYKTTGMSANPAAWERRLVAEYDIQAAWYLRGVAAVRGARPSGFRFVVQETAAPYLLSVLSPGPDVLALADRKIERALAIWRECRRTGRWPGYPTRVATVTLPGWVEARWLEREYREEVENAA